VLPYIASTVAESIHQVLDRAAAARGRATLAIPGGRSPGAVLTALAGMLDPFVRERLHLLWLDERAVPLGHADRNDTPTLAAWDLGGERPAYVHAMPAEAEDLDAAAEAYAQTLADATAGGSLDVCLVGIGEDGHFASLFPNHAGLKELSPVFSITDSPKPPPRRLSLSLSVIGQASYLPILALGAAKGDVARRARNDGSNPNLPVSLLPRDRWAWFLDDAAITAAQTP
jgi:6-phosphogluconolactonase